MTCEREWERRLQKEIEDSEEVRPGEEMIMWFLGKSVLQRQKTSGREDQTWCDDDNRLSVNNIFTDHCSLFFQKVF